MSGRVPAGFALYAGYNLGSHRTAFRHPHVSMASSRNGSDTLKTATVRWSRILLGPNAGSSTKRSPSITGQGRKGQNLIGDDALIIRPGLPGVEKGGACRQMSRQTLRLQRDHSHHQPGRPRFCGIVTVWHRQHRCL